MPTIRRTPSTVELELSPNVALTFTLGGGQVKGLSQATVNGLSLIAPGSLRLPHLETRDGWLASGFQLLNADADGDSAWLDLGVLAIRPPVGTKLDMFQFPFIGTPWRTPLPIGTLRWSFSPATLTLGQPGVRTTACVGFEYSFGVLLSHYFHALLDAGTWELEGDPEEVTLLSQHMHPAAGPAEFLVSRRGPPYTTAEAFERKDAPPPEDPSGGYILPIQAQVRGAGGAIVDVQYRDDAMLIGFQAEPSYCRTLVEWQPGAPGIGQLDHHFFPLTQRCATPAKTILVARVPKLTRAGAINRWTDAWEHVATLWRNSVGVPRLDPPITYSMTSITTAPCWGHPPEDMFARMEAQLDWMRDNGFDTLYTGHWGAHRGLDMPDSANACEPDDYLVHPRYGGPEALRRLTTAAHARGIKVSMWVCMHLSGRGPTLKAHPDWVVKYDSAAPWDGNYRCILACSLTSGFRDWLLDQLRQLRELGLDMIFFDSYNNLSASPIDFKDPALTPQFPELLKLQRDCQAMGLEMIIETVGPIGVTSCGLQKHYLHAPEMTYWTHFRANAKAFADGTLDEATCFRLLANKAPIGGVSDHHFSQVPQTTPELPPYLPGFNRLYQQLKPEMQMRCLLDDGNVAWANPASATRLLFVPGTGSATVPPGFTAQPLHGATATLPAGTHPVPGLAIFRLIPTE